MFDDYKTENQIHHPHDIGYKYLLSSKKVFMELLRSFVRTGWINKIDETSMIRVDKSYILQDFNTKEADLVYRLKIKEQDVIFYILMELQSSVDFQMPYRLLLYMVEIWRDLLKNIPKDESAKKNFRLPAIIPIVLYNGKDRWTARKSFKETLSCYEIFKEHILDFRYILIDVNRYKKRDLIKLSNTIGSIFLLDQDYDIIEIEERFKAVCNVMKHLDSDQFQLLTTWINKIICTSASNELLENIVKIIDTSLTNKEVDDIVSNFARTLKKMQEQAKAEGLEQGIEHIAKKMLKRNISEEIVAEITELPLTHIIRLKRELNNQSE